MQIRGMQAMIHCAASFALAQQKVVHPQGYISLHVYTPPVTICDWAGGPLYVRHSRAAGCLVVPQCTMQYTWVCIEGKAPLFPSHMTLKLDRLLLSNCCTAFSTHCVKTQAGKEHHFLQYFFLVRVGFGLGGGSGHLLTLLPARFPSNDMEEIRRILT